VLFLHVWKIEIEIEIKFKSYPSGNRSHRIASHDPSFLKEELKDLEEQTAD